MSVVRLAGNEKFVRILHTNYLLSLVSWLCKKLFTLTFTNGIIYGEGSLVVWGHDEFAELSRKDDEVYALALYALYLKSGKGEIG